MLPQRLTRTLSGLVRSLVRLFGRRPPEDPYAYVTAPKEPVVPHLTASAKKRLDED